MKRKLSGKVKAKAPKCLPVLLVFCLAILCACGAGEDKADLTADAKRAWPAEVREVMIPCSYDGSGQPALFWTPSGEGPHPLLVALHTWSGDYLQIESLNYWQWCREQDWVFIHPDFRGPNLRPGACASEAAVNDVLDALEYAKKNAAVDPRRIYLIGVSGGGHMTLTMAGRFPGHWTAASAWVPITDLAAWHGQCLAAGEPDSRYATNMEAVCGGPPGLSIATDSCYARRSPLSWLSGAAGLPLDINAGIHDGHTGSVPISHSLNAFNLLAGVNGHPDRVIPREFADRMVEGAEVPAELAGQDPEDILYGGKRVLFRREAGPARITIFEGGHEGIYRAGLTWLSRQVK